MKRVTRNGMIAVVAASGAMAVAAPVSAAFAASGASADGAATGSPGVISGNTVQLPVHVPVNVCGNTVNVVGLLNPAAGNRCADESGGRSAKAPEGQQAQGGANTGGGASAAGGGTDSPGVLSGNGVQLPVQLPVNVSGNSVNVVGVGDAAVGNESVNTPGDRPSAPDRPDRPVPPTPAPASPPQANPGPHSAAPGHFTGTLAHTGSDHTVLTVLGGAALVLGGAAVYRRHRPGAAR